MMPTLRKGSAGEVVAKLQRLLNTHAMLIGVDGSFGDQTEHAVRDYQTLHGLTVDGVVGPKTWVSLLSEQPPPIAFSAMVEQWRPLVEELHGDLDVGFLLSWIHHESGGNPCSTGIIKGDFCVEAGIGQLYFETPNSVEFGTTSSQLRAACAGTSPVCSRRLTEAEQRVQVASLVAMARAYRDRSIVQLHHITKTWSKRDVYKLTKLQHALPAVASMLLPALRPDTWDMFRERVETLTHAELSALAPPVARYFGDPLRRVMRNADATGEIVA